MLTWPGIAVLPTWIVVKNHTPIEYGRVDVVGEEQAVPQKDEEREIGIDKRGYVVGERAVDA